MCPADPQAANDVAAKAASKAENSDSEGSEPPLNEDDDDEDDDDEGDEQGDEEPKTAHLVLAQFDKVSGYLSYTISAFVGRQTGKLVVLLTFSLQASKVLLFMDIF
jgi:hypothetical protein